MRIAKTPPPAVMAWEVYLARALKARRLTPFGTADRVVRTAGLLALLGTPTDEPAAFSALAQLLFTAQRVKLWDRALEALPADPILLRRIIQSIHEANTFEPVGKAKLNILHFISVAQQLEDPATYIASCRNDGLDTLRAIFHPNTLDYTKAHQRGIVGDTASLAHRSDVVSRIEVVE